MRATSGLLASILTRSREVWCNLSVYYDGRPVLDELPIASGTLGVDAFQQVPGSISVSVARYLTLDSGVVLDLLPTAPGSPLSTDGTRLAVTYFVGLPGTSAEAVELGWFRIADWTEGNGTIELTAVSLEDVIQEARILDPIQVSATGTFADAATTLVDGLLPLKVETADAPAMIEQTFDEDRIGALGELLTAWPARAFVDDSGVLVIVDAYNDDTDPTVFTLTDGSDGTVVKVPRTGSRDGMYNAVKASGEETGDIAPVSATVYLTNGRRRWNGPFGNVPYFYSSPLLTTNLACMEAARTRLWALQASVISFVVECAPDPRYEVGDVGLLTYAGETLRVRIDALSLPLTYAGTMQLTVHELAEVS